MQPVTLNLSITSLLVFQWLAALIVLIIFAKVGRAYKKRPGKTPKGLQNAIEALVVYVRDEVIFPNCGSEKVAYMLFPYFIALFFFILACNLLGLVPGPHTATGALAVTGALAIIAYFVINIVAIRESGMGAWLSICSVEHRLDLPRL